MTRWSRVASVLALMLAVGPACKHEEVTAPSLSATCSAQPASGPAPLAVSFLVGVSGAQGTFNVAVTYGDGSTGTDPAAPHTYATAGDFIASFVVTTATQAASCAAAVAVAPGTGPTPGTNQPPKPVFKTNPLANHGTITGTAPLSVRFSMCPTSDPEGDTLYFTMDFNGDGHTDQGGTTGGNCRRDHVYAAGNWTAYNCVRDLDASGKALHEDQCATYTVVSTP
jgi:PKD domain-containing protein